MTDKEKRQFDDNLQRYLWKCELEYRAEHLPNGSKVDWLAPHCNSVQEIERFLRELGFGVRETLDKTDCYGSLYQWVVTTSGIIVYQNGELTRGLIAAAPRGFHREKT